MPQGNPEVTPESLRARVADSFPADLGVEPLEVTDERTDGRIVVDRRHLHPGGLVHGGAWVALADSVAAWQTFRHLPPGHNFTTIEMKLNVFAAGRPGDELIATAEHLHAGRTTHVVEVRVHCAERLVANLVVTQLVISPSPESETAPGASGRLARSRHPVDLEQVGAELLLRQPGGDPDQVAACGDSLLLGQPGALVEQRPKARPVLGERAADAEQELEPAHGLEPR